MPKYCGQPQLHIDDRYHKRCAMQMLTQSQHNWLLQDAEQGERGARRGRTFRPERLANRCHWHIHI